MKLVDLPCEIVSHTASYFHFSIFPCFALTCKKFYTLSFDVALKDSWSSEDVEEMALPATNEWKELQIGKSKTTNTLMEKVKTKRQAVDWYVGKLLSLGRLEISMNALLCVAVKNELYNTTRTIFQKYKCEENLLRSLGKIAAMHGTPRILCLVLDHMDVDNVNVARADGYANCAIQSGNVEMYKILLSRFLSLRQNGVPIEILYFDNLHMMQAYLEFLKNPMEITGNLLTRILQESAFGILNFLVNSDHIVLSKECIDKSIDAAKDHPNHTKYLKILSKHPNFVARFKQMEMATVSKDYELLGLIAQKLNCSYSHEIEFLFKSNDWQAMKSFLENVLCIGKYEPMCKIYTTCLKHENGINFLINCCFEKSDCNKEMTVGSLLATACYYQDTMLMERVFGHQGIKQLDEMKLFENSHTYHNNTMTELMIKCFIKNEKFAALAFSHCVAYDFEFACSMYRSPLGKELNPDFFSDHVFEKLANEEKYDILESLVSDPRVYTSNKKKFIKAICVEKYYKTLDIVFKHAKKEEHVSLSSIFLGKACSKSNPKIIEKVSAFVHTHCFNESNKDQVMNELMTKKVIDSTARTSEESMKMLLDCFPLNSNILKQVLLGIINDFCPRPDVFRMVLKRASKLFNEEEYEKELLIYATSKRHHKFASMLLKEAKANNYKINFQNLIPILIDINHCKLVEELLCENPHVNPVLDNHKGFLEACSRSQSEMVSVLLKHPNVNPCFDNNKALAMKFKHNICPIVRLLMNDKRVNPYGNPIPTTMDTDIIQYIKTPFYSNQ